MSRPASAKAQLRANVDSINNAIARITKQFTELRATFEKIGRP
ncbi:hypothetical protein PP556_14665 [Mycobacteroides abscessus]|nr:hypothetical protein [Mycobacteroides abscessus]MDM2451172.1 hypothetical protein [Mycobacteroides abscessus]MDM2455682.1 hypothetical protein [Mycobacteroides abscessus]MDM2460434.1 hypothetical protein [Mycobacteroides abscessus]MDM2466134.1 hypothetical protein [Mycobacteroides abscessus]